MTQNYRVLQRQPVARGKKGNFLFTKTMFKAKRKIVITSLVALIGVLVGALSVSLTWFAKMNSIDNLEIGGSVLSQYFDSGTGTQSDPFVITRPKHWENLVWLHNNVSNFYQAITDPEVEPGQQSDQGYFFQVGKQVNGQGDYYVYDYNDSGLINPQNSSLNSRVLNLKGLGSLIPIGCDTKPFLGVVNGHGITVSGFEVLGFEDVNYNLQHDSGEAGFNDVGIFGYIGNDSAVQNIYFNDFKIHLANASTTRSNNTVLHNETFHASTENGGPDTCFAGYIAGHMHYSSSVTGVYINNCTIDGGTAATTGFGYFGVVEEQNGGTRPTPLEEVQEIKQAGDANNFGGSLDFYSVFERLSQIYNTTSTTTYYVDNQTLVVNDKTGSLTGETKDLNDPTRDSLYHHETAVTNNNGINYRYADYDDYGGGVFNFPNDNDLITSGNTNIYQCLYGESSKYTKTVTTYTFTDETYECFLIQNGDNYLNHRYYPTLQAETDENYAAGWRFTGENTGNLYTKVFDVSYYLNRNGYSLTLSTTANTTWTRSSDDEIYTVINGVNYYLDYENVWCLSPYADRYTINDGNNHYLTANNTSITNSTTEAAATKFFLTNASGDTAIGFQYNNNIYYIGNTNENLSISTSPVTWTIDGSYYYVTVQGIHYYLVYDGGWKLQPGDGVRLGDGSNHYITSTNNSSVSNTTLNNSVIWHYTSDNGATQIFYIANGTKYYLNHTNANELTVTTSAFTWNRNGNGLYYSVGDFDYYLTYQNNGWRVVDLKYVTINDGNGHYLSANGTNTFSNSNAANATHFYFSNIDATNPYGTINYVYNGTIYYLNLSISNSVGTLQSVTSSNSTSWSNDGSSIYYQSGDYTYYLEYKNDNWIIRKYADAYYISDGNAYMTVSGTTIGYSTDVNAASLFIFENGGNTPNGTANVLGTTNYLRNNNGTLQISATSTSWNNDGNNLNNNGYYLKFSDNAWRLSTDRSVGYYISRSNYYLNLSGTTISTTTTASTIWSGTSGNIKAVGTNYYLNVSQTGSSGDYLNGSTESRSWNNSSNVLYFTNSESNGWWSQTYYYTIYLTNNNRFEVNRRTGGSYGTNSTLTFTSANGVSRATHVDDTITNTIVSKTEINVIPSITTTNYSANKNSSANYSYTKDYSMGISAAELQYCEKDIETNVRSGNPTYFPLRVDKDDQGNYPTGWAASDKNTGYLISGANCEDSSSTASGQKKWGDIRIAGWAKSNINGSYTNGDFTTIYTINDSNSNQPTAVGTSITSDPNYQEALSQFKTTLGSANKVFGMHFMDASISKEHTIRARKATILGQTYYDYELPEDAVDFNVNTKGNISFFAGNYFYDSNTSALNDSFCSLHRIFRDANNNITDIKEIIEVYQRSTNANRANYIYLFNDNTYTDPNGGYTGQTTLDSAYSSTPVFKTSWIKNPSNLATNSSNRNRLFYFSIPCNSGEYALGSVSGKTGAYLCYLDIAANGGDTVLSYMHDPTICETFDVDYRSAPGTSDHCILELGAQLQASANPQNLSISVTFDNSAANNANTPHSNGVYIIHVTNKTGATLELSVLLTDDDDDLYNDFLYSYQIIYTNEDHTDTIIYGEDIYEEYNELVDVPYWKRMATFVIPSSGAAHESDYGASS